jgi:hypothetical protein
MIAEVLNHKIFAFGMYLDIEGAFDNASFASLIQKYNRKD